MNKNIIFNLTVENTGGHIYVWYGTINNDNHFAIRDDGYGGWYAIPYDEALNWDEDGEFTGDMDNCFMRYITANEALDIMTSIDEYVNSKQHHLMIKSSIERIRKAIENGNEYC